MRTQKVDYFHSGAETLPKVLVGFAKSNANKGLFSKMTGFVEMNSYHLIILKITQSF
tara:strand:+ start:392 stop:562 length:171 start_codon:yes stop_codon:yes gene_type:complete